MKSLDKSKKIIYKLTILIFTILLVQNAFALKSSKTNIKYYLSYNNDSTQHLTDLQFSTETKKDGNISSNADIIKSFESYYEVHYIGNKFSKVNRYYKGSLVNEKFFDADGRISKELRNGKTIYISYKGKIRTSIFKVANKQFKKYISEFYNENNMMSKRTVYDKDNNIVEYYLYEENSSKYKIYDKNGKFIIEEYLMGFK